MPAKKRCQFQADTDVQCNSAALRIVGQCPHCRVQFCGAVSSCYIQALIFSIHCDSIVCPNITAALIWRTAGNRRLSGTRPSWRANGRWHPSWLQPSYALHAYEPVYCPPYVTTFALSLILLSRVITSSLKCRTLCCHTISIIIYLSILFC